MAGDKTALTFTTFTGAAGNDDTIHHDWSCALLTTVHFGFPDQLTRLRIQCNKEIVRGSANDHVFEYREVLAACPGPALLCVFHFTLVLPKQIAFRGVQCQDDSFRSQHIHRTVIYQRDGLDLALTANTAAPGELQFGH